MQILKSITLDFGTGSEYKTVYAKRYENMNSSLEISLLNYGESFELQDDMIPKMQLLKPDGKFVVTECTKNYGGAADKILVEFPAQSFAVPGMGRAEIALHQNGRVLTAQKFYIEIEDNEITDAFSSSDEFRALDEALSQTAGIISSAQTAADSADSAAGAANTAADKANTAAGLANTAASDANTAAEGAEKVNISSVQTASGAQITTTDRTGAQTTVNINIENAPAARYGVRFDGAANTAETVHRLYNAVGLRSGVGTDTQAAINDFDNIYPWSARKRCCGNFDADGNFIVNAYEGEPGYAVDGSNGEVWVENSLFYYSHKYTDDGAEEIIISATPLPDMLPAPIFVNSDGTLKQKAYIAAYPMAVIDGKATSRSGVFSIHGLTMTELMSAAKTLGEGFAITRADERYTESLLMFVEFATRDVQHIMRGATDMRDANIIEAGTNTNSIMVSADDGNNFVAGQTINIGTVENRCITEINYTENRDKASIVFDGAPVNVSASDTAESAAWKNGSCDNVLSSSGSYVSNTDCRHNCIYRGKEQPYGNAYEKLSDILVKRTGSGSSESPYHYEIWFLKNINKFSAAAITDDYAKLNYELPAENGYVKKLGYDSRYPGIRLPCETGAAASTYYSDYYYKLTYPNSSGVGIAECGGSFASGPDAGANFYDCRFNPNETQLQQCARLSAPRK